MPELLNLNRVELDHAAAINNLEEHVGNIWRGHLNVRQENIDPIHIEDEIMPFIDEDEDDELDENLAEDWVNSAIDALARNVPIPQAPTNDIYVFDYLGVKYNWNNFDGLTVAPVPEPRPRRGQRAKRDDGRDIPAGINPPPIKAPRLAQKPFKPMKNKVFPPFGVKYNGYLFSRDLDLNEKITLAQYGYHDLIKKVPELKYQEKEELLDENEECVILIAELADHLAITACKAHVPDFSLETHSSEYQAVYKRYVKEISSFKRNTNG